MEPLRVTIEDHGIFAEHNMPCAVRGCEGSAVLDLATGLFQPCWQHHEHLVLVAAKRRRRWWQFWRRR